MRRQVLQQMIAPTVEMLGFELVGCEQYQQGGLNILQVIVDAPKGVTLEDCAKISRQVGAVLDVEDPIRGHYNLEVSSPGLERPLYTIDHYRRFIGRCVKIRLRVKREGQRQWIATLLGVDDDQIALQLDGSTLNIPFNEIERANLVAEYSGVKKR